MNAIPTTYKGYKFRSRLEAKWACFFDAMGCEWEYEPEGFQIQLPGNKKPTWYLPDFFVRSGIGWGDGCWIEIKPNGTDCDNSRALRLIKGVSHDSDTSTLLIQGNPYPSEYKILGHYRPGSDHTSFHNRGGRFVYDDRYLRVVEMDNTETFDPADYRMLMDAFTTARQERFTREPGEGE
jgi:hypothetical protein